MSGESVPGQQLEGLLHNLAQANNFTIEDLSANRIGRLSRRQMQRLRRQSAGYRFTGIVAIVIGVAAGVWSLATINSSSMTQLHRFVLGASILSLIIGVGSLGVGRSRAQDVTSSTVNPREGILKPVCQPPPTTGTGGGMPTYLYVIGGASYTVSVQAWKAAVGDLRYRAYETRDGVLLSIEPLHSTPIATPPPPPPPPPTPGAPFPPDFATVDRVAASGYAPPAIPVRAAPSTTLTGRANSTPQPFQTRGGLVILDVTCSGSGTAGIRILSARGEELQFPIYAQLADQGGFLRTSWGTRLDPGTYMLAVDHAADLALSGFRWKVIVTQPGEEGSVRLPTTYKGRRRAVVGPFFCGSAVHLAAENTTRRMSGGHFSISVLSNDGMAVEAIRNGPPVYRGVVMVSGLTRGAHWLNVGSDGKWTITLSEA